MNHPTNAGRRILLRLPSTCPTRYGQTPLLALPPCVSSVAHSWPVATILRARNSDTPNHGVARADISHS